MAARSSRSPEIQHRVEQENRIAATAQPGPEKGMAEDLGIVGIGDEIGRDLLSGHPSMEGPREKMIADPIVTERQTLSFHADDFPVIQQATKPHQVIRQQRTVRRRDTDCGQPFQPDR